MGRILVVDDDAGILAAFETLLRGRGHDVITAETAEDASRLVEAERPDVVVVDVVLPGMDGLAFFRSIKAVRAATPVIVMTGSGTMDVAIDASKLGAFEYIPKPFDPAHMLQSIESALESTRAARRRQEGEPAPARIWSDPIEGKSPGMREVFKIVGRVAATDATVLIRGESGTGKRLVAEAIHRHSTRGGEPLVVVDCAGTAEAQLDLELFGSGPEAAGAAGPRRPGMFERAHRGTILLGEIGVAPPAIQRRLIRVLEDRTLEGAGGVTRLDVRVLATTRCDLERALQEGRFREDLYQQLHGVRIHVPALRERREDIPGLVSTFLAKLAVEFRIGKAALSDEARSMVESYSWPGNVRELEFCLKRAMVFSRGGTIQREDLLRALDTKPAAAGTPGWGAEEDLLRDYVKRYLETHRGQDCEPKLMEAVERELIVEALRRAGGNQTRAAEMLGMARPTLHSKLGKHGIRVAAVVEESERRPARGRDSS